MIYVVLRRMKHSHNAHIGKLFVVSVTALRNIFNFSLTSVLCQPFPIWLDIETDDTKAELGSTIDYKCKVWISKSTWLHSFLLKI